MDIIVILYGPDILPWGKEMTYQKINRSLSTAFVQEHSVLVSKPKFSGRGLELEKLEISIGSTVLPVPRLFFADIFLTSKALAGCASDNIHVDFVDALSACLGKLWVEYVRTFVDAGAAILCRVKDGKFQSMWSPHGDQTKR